nr:MAG TPA: helix-turn-helix domain protein [Caudoviricetes sp.]
MTREEYLKGKIKEYGMTQREFAANIGMPSSTLFSILRNVGGASIDNIIKICRGLHISPEDLANVGEPITLPHERKGYYVDAETAAFAEYLRTRPDAHMLFSAAKDISKEDMEKAVEYIELLKLKNK